MSDKTQDELEIRDLVARYSDAVNRNDEAAWRNTWAEDGVWEMMGNAFEGRDTVVTVWRGAMGTFDYALQLVHSGVLEIEGDEARGRWTLTELASPRGGTPSSMVALYHDVYRRTSEGWRFGNRRLEVVYQGPPDLSGTYTAPRN